MKPELNVSWERLRYVLLWIALPLLLGVLIAAAVPRPQIGIVRLGDAIYETTSAELIAQIIYAREHPEVRAVVLVLESPGGTVVHTEAVYMELARLRQTKPVVTSVDGMAASGAYYLSVGTDYIYAKPTSLVGNVGVIGVLPPAPFIFEDIISTGPYKLWGSPRDTYLREIEVIKQEFYRAVELGRGERLQVGPEVVLRGQIWLGNEAVANGLADALGTESDAIAKAAELARVQHYEVVDLRALALGDEASLGEEFFYRTVEGELMPFPKEAGLYLLYIPPLPVEK